MSRAVMVDIPKSNPRPSVSVALCTHNGAAFIEEQLLSILRQSSLPHEIVLSDDASTDDTVAKARAVIKRHTDSSAGQPIELRLIRNAVPLGVTANFEQAVRACNGELIVLCDQDDRWSSERVATAVSYFADRPDLLLLHGNAQLIDDSGENLPLTLFESLEIPVATILDIHAGRAFDVLMRRNVVTGATTMMRRDLVEMSVPFPRGWVHDEWLAIMASAMGQVDVTTDLLVDYRQHGANQIGVRKLTFAGKLRRMLEPGAERNRRLLERSRELASRFELLGESLASLRLQDAARQKLRHEVIRGGLSRHRLLRVVPVIRELANGRYFRFGYGVADAVRDLIQPL